MGLSLSDRPQVMFLDLAWGGKKSSVTYPPFVNGKVVRTVSKPDGQPILQDHDVEQLKDTTVRCRDEQHGQLSKRSRLRAAAHAYKHIASRAVFFGRPTLFHCMN